MSVQDLAQLKLAIERGDVLPQDGKVRMIGTSTILALLSELEQAESDKVEWKKSYDGMCILQRNEEEAHRKTAAQLEQAERERDELAKNQRQKNIDKYCKRAKDAEAETARLRAKAKRATEMCENLADVWNDLSISDDRRKELNDLYMKQILDRTYDNDVDAWVMFERESWLKNFNAREKREAALRTLREASAWIPVSERLPNPYPERVLFATTDRGVYKGWRYQATISHGSRGGEKYWKWVSRGDGDWEDEAVTHWMPLPESPKDLAAALAAEGGK